MGLFYRDSSANLGEGIVNSVIVENTVDYMVGGSSTLSFVNCQFDTLSFTVSGVVIETVDCFLTSSAALLPPCVASVTTLPTRSQAFSGETESVQSSARLSETWIFALSVTENHSHEFVPTNSFAPSEDSEAPDESESASTVLWAGIGVGVGTLVLMTVGAILFFQFRRHHLTTGLDPESEDDARATVTRETLLDWNEAILEGAPVPPSSSSYKLDHRNYKMPGTAS
jgi:hypothetical protein